MVFQLITEIKSYMPQSGVEVYKILKPSEFPENEADQHFYGLEEIKDLARIFNLQGNMLLNEWRAFLPLVTSHKDFCTLKEAKTIYFYKFYLDMKDIHSNVNFIGNELRKLVTKVMTIPLSSADAERGFSTLFHIRSSKRSRLTPEHLESYLRLRLNGPKEISKFQAVTYAQAWKTDNKMLTDSREGIKRAKKVILDDDEDIETFHKAYLDGSNIF